MRHAPAMNSMQGIDPICFTTNALRGRPAKDPPKGVVCCHSCQTTVTSEWRMGPRGVKDMCNACGLRWNRRLKKMKRESDPLNIPGVGDMADVGGGEEVSLEGTDTDALLEPQRSGGGSKKGHRKQNFDPNKIVPLTIELPSKARRYSDVEFPSPSSMNAFGDGMDQETKYNPLSHPHNTHYSHSGPSSPISSPTILSPLFKDKSKYSPPAGHSMHLQKPTNFQSPYDFEPLPSYSPRRRRNSIRSTGSCGSTGTRNSDEKSEGGEQPDWFEASQIPKHWKTGAAILRRLQLSTHRNHMRDLSFDRLNKAIESLSSATKEVNLNAKAWSAVGTTLSRHVRRLKSCSPSHNSCIPIQEYTKVLKHIPALWIRSVDPSIHLPYDMLAPHERPKRFPQDRHELSIFTLDYITEPTDEDAIYKQKNGLDEAFNGIADEISGEIAFPSLESSQSINEWGREGLGGSLEERLERLWAAEKELAERERLSRIGSTGGTPI